MIEEVKHILLDYINLSNITHPKKIFGQIITKLLVIMALRNHHLPWIYWIKEYELSVFDI